MAPLPVPLEAPDVLPHGDHIYVMGGVTYGVGPSDAVLRYSIANDTWEELGLLPKHTRLWHPVAWVGDDLVVVDHGSRFDRSHSQAGRDLYHAKAVRVSFDPFEITTLVDLKDQATAPTGPWLAYDGPGPFIGGNGRWLKTDALTGNVTDAGIELPLAGALANKEGIPLYAFGGGAGGRAIAGLDRHGNPVLMNETLPCPVGSGEDRAFVDGDSAYAVTTAGDSYGTPCAWETRILRWNATTSQVETWTSHDQVLPRRPGIAWAHGRVWLIGGEDLTGKVTLRNVTSMVLGSDFAPNQPPVPRISWETREGVLHVNARTSTDSDGRIVAWNWSLGVLHGDATSAKFPYPIENETLTLEIKDNWGTSGIATVRLEGSSRSHVGSLLAPCLDSCPRVSPDPRYWSTPHSSSGPEVRWGTSYNSVDGNRRTIGLNPNLPGGSWQFRSIEIPRLDDIPPRLDWDATAPIPGTSSPGWYWLVEYEAPPRGYCKSWIVEVEQNGTAIGGAQVNACGGAGEQDLFGSLPSISASWSSASHWTPQG